MKAPLVVGYKGEIGSFILQGLLRVMPKAGNIYCVDINETKKEVIDRIKKSDYIFLCVPMHKTLSWVDIYKSHLKDKIIVEQTSVKTDIVNQMKKWKLKVISMHILFRPSITPNSEDRRAVLILPFSKSSDESYKYNCFASLIGKMIGLTWTSYDDSSGDYIFAHISDIEEHDKAMATHQSLIHKVILKLQKELEYPACSQTYIGGVINRLAERIKAGDPKLYKAIQDNQYAKEALEKFKEKL